MTKDSALARWVSTVLLIGALACVHAHAGQAGQREVRQTPSEPGSQSPVEIVSVRVKGQTVEPGRRFEGGDDWLAGLVLRVKNVSDVPIAYVEVRLRFPTPAGDKREGVGLIGLMSYGCCPGYPCKPDAAGSSKEIMPGQTQDIELTGEAYGRLLSALAQVGARTPVESAEYEIDTVIFDADTRWSRGFLLKRDPASPNTFRTASRYALPKKP
jgi:hypothetical protein